MGHETPAPLATTSSQPTPDISSLAQGKEGIVIENDQFPDKFHAAIWQGTLVAISAINIATSLTKIEPKVDKYGLSFPL